MSFFGVAVIFVTSLLTLTSIGLLNDLSNRIAPTFQAQQAAAATTQRLDAKTATQQAFQTTQIAQIAAMTETAQSWTETPTSTATWTPRPTWTFSPTPNHTATLAAAFAVQTARAFDATATAMWWTPMPTATHTPIPTKPPTATPIVVAADNREASAAVRDPDPAASSSNGNVAGALLVLLAGVLGAGALGIGYYAVKRQPQPSLASLPALSTRPWRGSIRVRWIDAVEHSALVGAGLPPHLAGVLIHAWGEPAEVSGHTARTHVTAFWRAVLTTLNERNMLRRDEEPQVRFAIVAPDRVIYVLDMAHLAGVPLEKWTADSFVEQLRATTGGCRVVVTAEGGLVIQISRVPVVEVGLDPEPEPLPTLAPLDLTTRPRPAYSVGIGVSHNGPAWAPLESLGHIMVSGSTGSGKSYFLRSLAYQLIKLPKNQPVMLYLADRAGNVFTPLDAYRVPQLAAPVAKTPEAVVEMLDAAIAEMQRRERLFDAEINHFPDKLAEYNAIPGVKPLARAVVIVDEVTVLVAETGGERGEVHQALLTLSAQGRKYGFTVVVAGQDFKASTFNTALTHQLATRIAFKAGSAHESRVVLGEEGAERLRGAGHGLLRHGGRLIEFQGFYVDKKELIARCAQIGEEPEGAQSPQLSEWETSLVRYALEHLDGVMKRAALVDAGLGSEYEIKKQIETWRDVGLIIVERRQVGVAERDVLVISPRLAAMVR